MRQVLSTALVALIVGALAGATVSAVAQSPAEPVIVPSAVSTINADKVDGRHAVGSGASKAKRARKLVATNSSGYLPSNIVKPYWRNIKNMPAGFADGVDNRGVTKIIITRVRSPFPVPIDPGETADVTATCPAGSKVVGGGFFQGNDYVTITASHPYSTDSWRVSGRNDDDWNQNLWADAICMTTKPGTAITTASRGVKPARRG